VTEPDFNSAVIDALRNRAASLPTERVQALAALIEQRGPALVGLQEVYEFSCVDTNPLDLKGCENPEISGAFTDQLLDTLAALGGEYEEAATVVNLNLPDSLGLGLPGIPVAYDGTMIYVGVVDRDVILARSGVQHSVTNFAALAPLACVLPSEDGCNYQAAAEAVLVIAGMPVTIRFERGFVGVDAIVDGVPYRFVNTHLETRLGSFGPSGRFFQAAQTAELLGTLQAYGDFVVPLEQVLVVGDFNSDPRDQAVPVPPPLPGYLGLPPYMQMSLSGFTDAWTLRPGSALAPLSKATPAKS
jgi:hypothetical protein